MRVAAFLMVAAFLGGCADKASLRDRFGERFSSSLFDCADRANAFRCDPQSPRNKGARW